MSLSGLLGLIEHMPSYSRLVGELQAGKGEKQAVLIDAAKPYLLACLRHHLGLPVLVIAASPERARQLHDEIAVWVGGSAPVQLFPEPDALPYERLSSDPYTIQQRLRVLYGLARGGKAPLVVASAHAAAWKTVPAADFASSCQTVEKGMRIDLERMLAKWTELGYKLQNTVQFPGTVSQRGGIVDIYPPNSDLPARIELFGNEVDSVRLFDPASQRSVEVVPKVGIAPAMEMIVPAAELADALRRLDLSGLDAEMRDAIEEETERLNGGQRVDGIDFYASAVNHGAVPDYLTANALVVLDRPDLIEASLGDLDGQAAELRRGQTERGQLPIDFPVPYLMWSELLEKLNRFHRRLILEQWGDESECCVMSFSPAPAYSGRLAAFFEDARNMSTDKRRIIVVSQQAKRLSELLAEQDMLASPVADVDRLPPSGSLTLVQGSLAGGWALDEARADILFSDVELFGFVKQRRQVARRPVLRDEFLSELSLGDYVVHIDHGIGRFSGLTRLGFDDGEREYLVLEYAAGDRLYVPTEQVDRVGRYIGPGGYSPSLSRLGTQEWNRAKQRVREAASDLAKALLDLYSARQVVSGLAFSPDSLWQQELEDSFPYVETPDQFKAVQDVKRDMERARPMDRLVCGDVGYGKTEVALRAAFKAVMDGMQVAVLVPTTVLAQQHFTTFVERMGAFPVRTELLSRFRSPKEQQEVLQGLANSSVDICVGTHRLLQKDVFFKNLGLVIIDEEQRFGVAHKERLKQLRREVDVLTLSATPIPRTLHMALVGVRDMSTMETPPEERLPIKSYVATYNERLVREAILRELERNGQVFYVHNRVRRIGWVARELQRIVPEARIAIAHGQMLEDSLESVMIEFAQRRIDVLVCTTIIESGLDLPNVNTLIIDDADKLGLTQLYQLRGRVGRGSNRAYAYFLYKKGERLTDTAQKRLKTIFEATELGAGFRIAMKDLEIRGAGNILGPEQSGNMGAVGFDLYCRLLAEAAAKLKGEAKLETAAEPVGVTVDLPLPAYIPDDYIADLSTRLALYMRMSRVGSLQEVDEMMLELEDRFGRPPLQLRNLLYVLRLKLLGTTASVHEISSEMGQIIIRMGPGVRVDRASMQRRFGSRLRVGTRQLRLDTKRMGGKWREALEEVLDSIPRSIDSSQPASSSEFAGSR